MGTFKRPENNDKCRQQDQSRCLAELMAFHTKLQNAPIVPIFSVSYCFLKLLVKTTSGSTVSMPTYSNFQINGASGETFKVFVAIFTTIKVAIFK